MEYLDINGLNTLWSKIVDKFGDQSDEVDTKINNLSKTIANTYVTTTDLTTKLNSYLTTSAASSTYLTKTDASSIYLTKSTASSTYATTAQATYTAGNYISISNRKISCTYSYTLTKSAIIDALGYTPGTSSSEPITYSAGTGISISGTTISVDTSTIATKSYVDSAVASASSGGTVDLSGYAKLTDLAAYAKTSDLSSYAKTSDLSDYVEISNVTTSGSGNAITGVSIDSSTGKIVFTYGTISGGSSSGTTSVSVTNKNATLSFGSSHTIATVAGTDITVVMPSAPSSGNSGSIVSVATEYNSGDSIAIITVDGTAHTIYTPIYATKSYVDNKVSEITSAAGGDGNTTYELSISGQVVTLTGSDSSTSKVTIPTPTSVSYATKAGSADSATSATSATTATTASKLSTSAGSATQPVYFANGVPVACTYTLGASVPANAKFTDTTYSAATTSTAGLMSASDKAKLDKIDVNNLGGSTVTVNPILTSGTKIATIKVDNNSYTLYCEKDTDTGTTDSAISTSDIESLCTSILG